MHYAFTYLLFVESLNSTLFPFYLFMLLLTFPSSVYFSFPPYNLATSLHLNVHKYTCVYSYLHYLIMYSSPSSFYLVTFTSIPLFFI
ncbi:hypothetical protein BC941DRAFT_412814 [Chlamydoabsidia padenii]|nr:hypothetical protein BC941DRAFT_412814 [Chlamydoabsidia padenii]